MARADRAFDNSPTWARLHASDRRVFAAAAASVATFAAAGVAAWYWQAAELDQANRAMADARLANARLEQRAEAERKAVSQAPEPWWSQLPAAASGERNAAEQLSADALSLGPKLGVQVQRLSMSPVLPAAGAPYRSVAVKAEVRGGYADIKRWLGELLARRPQSLALKTIDWRKVADGGASSAVEASVDLRLFERAAAR